MNVIFLTLVEINSIEDRGIYHDLLRKFRNEGHDVTIVTPQERRKGVSTNHYKKEGVSILQVKTLNIQKTNFIEKGIGTLAIEYQYLWAIKKYFATKKFDLILYSTPPITLVKVIQFLKIRDNAISYLLLKDIFPQNAVDMKLISERSLLFKYFRKKEIKLYMVSDKIGCMSKANVEFVLKHNSDLDCNKVEINPNSIEIKRFKELTLEEKNKIKNKFNIPLERKIFIYGGNLGKPQGIDFLIETLISMKNDRDIYIIIVGSGTEYYKIENCINKESLQNVKLISVLPKKDFDELLMSCDIGLIFLHKNFKIPNYPSRLLSYLEFKMPVLSATDANTDIGLDLINNNCGIAVNSDNLNQMINAINCFKMMSENEFNLMRNNSYKFLESNFQVEYSYKKIVNSLQLDI